MALGGCTNGVLHLLARRTKPRSPTTTGKIERFHRTLREELLSHDGQLVRTVASRLRPEDLRHLMMRGARRPNQHR